MNRVDEHNKKHNASNRAWVAVALIVVALMAWGQMDTAANELDAEQAHYCEMVEQGNWPDYKETYEESCK